MMNVGASAHCLAIAFTPRVRTTRETPCSPSTSARNSRPDTAPDLGVQKVTGGRPDAREGSDVLRAARASAAFLRAAAGIPGHNGVSPFSFHSSLIACGAVVGRQSFGDEVPRVNTT